MRKSAVVAVLAGVQLVGVLVAVTTAMLERRQDWLMVENRSGQILASLQVASAFGDLVFHDVADGANASSLFPDARIGNCVIKGRLADGTEFEEHYRCLNGGPTGMEFAIVIQPSGKIESSLTRRK